MTSAMSQGNRPRGDSARLRSLIRRFLPQWADLSIEELSSSGTDNRLFRLGADLLVRLPRSREAAQQLTKQHQWLPVLAPHLPLEVPQPIALVEPSDDSSLPWSVVRWIDGAPLSFTSESEEHDGALALAAFASALRAQDASDGPSPGEHNALRGVPLAARDTATRAALESLRSEFDVAALLAIWDDALAAAPRVATWIHGDLLPANLLMRDGRLAAVIDFGLMAVGDPATDLLPAWTIFGQRGRRAFLSAAGLDPDSVRRGRGWALSFAAIAWPYYRPTGHPLAATAAFTLNQLLID